jgi:hypothetical protein
MVYIVGVDHLVQYNGPVPEPLREEFKHYIIDASRRLGIDILAEEFSCEALHRVYAATEGTVMKAAELLGIEHRYCDPEEADLRSMGIPYYAEARDRIKKKYGVSGTFIFDDELRKRVEQETADLTRSYWHLREHFWYERIKDAVDSQVLFICGHEHVNRFHEMLERKGHASKIIDGFWAREVLQDYSNIGLD